VSETQSRENEWARRFSLPVPTAFSLLVRRGAEKNERKKKDTAPALGSPTLLIFQKKFLFLFSVAVCRSAMPMGENGRLPQQKRKRKSGDV
jgi:hypothetical protein